MFIGLVSEKIIMPGLNMTLFPIIYFVLDVITIPLEYFKIIK